jgi:hypothetical protein
MVNRLAMIASFGSGQRRSNHHDSTGLVDVSAAMPLAGDGPLLHGADDSTNADCVETGSPIAD